MSAPRGGFTLIEAIVALTLSSVLVVLVGTTFLVQNGYYSTQLARTAAQDNARMVTEMVASELRSLTDSAVLTAESQRLVVRSPMVMAAVCAQISGPTRIAVQFEGGESALAVDEVSGFAIRDTLTDVWSYYDLSRNWGRIASAGDAPGDCAANGADTVGARHEFKRLTRINTYTGGYWPAPGTLMMFYREVEYRVQTSAMDPSTLGLFRRVSGGTLVELATGLDASTQFQYRTGGSTYADRVTGATLGAIDAIRIVAQARTRPQSGGLEDVTAGWAVNVHLRNAR